MDADPGTDIRAKNEYSNDQGSELEPEPESMQWEQFLYSTI